MKQKLPIDGLYPNLHKSNEVQNSVKKSEQYKKLDKKEKSHLLTKNNDKLRMERIDIHLERYAKLFDRTREENKDGSKIDRNIKMLKSAAHNAYVIKPEEVPISVYELDQKIALERGQGYFEITDEYKVEKNNQIIREQEQSLNRWVDYLSSDDAFYEPWFKYYVFDSITKMGKLDKKNWTYKQRKAGDGTVAPFAEINSEALSQLQILLKDKFRMGDQETLLELTKDDYATNINFKKVLSSGSFRKLYPLIQKRLLDAREAGKELRETIEGSWTKYNKGTDEYVQLAESLQGYGTGWCTAGEDTAKDQLETGDFYVFYSKDEKGVDKVPRIAIRMEDDKIAEVRGINDNQALEPMLHDTMEEKAKNLGGYDKYKKKTEDMKRVTEIYQKENIDNRDLVFLREVSHFVEGFGYGLDDRVKELLEGREAIDDYRYIQKLFSEKELELSAVEAARLDVLLQCEIIFQKYSKDEEFNDDDIAFITGLRGDALLVMERELDEQDEHRTIWDVSKRLKENILMYNPYDEEVLLRISTREDFEDKINPLSEKIYYYDDVNEKINEIEIGRVFDYRLKERVNKIKLETGQLQKEVDEKLQNEKVEKAVSKLINKNGIVDSDKFAASMNELEENVKHEVFIRARNINEILKSLQDNDLIYLLQDTFSNLNLSLNEFPFDSISDEQLVSLLENNSKLRRKLIKHPDVNIRCEVAIYESDPVSLMELGRDKNFRVRKNVASNLKANEHTLKLLLLDEKNGVRQAAKRNLANRK